MKTLFALSLMAALLVSETACSQKMPDLDKSPVDISYFPVRGGEKIVKVIYGRPQKNGREVFGKLVDYGKVWRTGANEATEIKFYRDVKFGGQEVKAGTYTLFTIPEKEEWTIILNSVLDQWGAYGYDEKKDVVRVKGSVKKMNQAVDSFSILFDDEDQKIQMVLAWDNVRVSVPIE
ncbi:MAG: DUF2911 domain-containing protein [Cytophagales bacterium]|nr:DUF2911 domain-containing protein [Cytophagales bacterium]